MYVFVYPESISHIWNTVQAVTERAESLLYGKKETNRPTLLFNKFSIISNLQNVLLYDQFDSFKFYFALSLTFRIRLVCLCIIRSNYNIQILFHVWTIEIDNIIYFWLVLLVLLQIKLSRWVFKYANVCATIIIIECVCVYINLFLLYFIHMEFVAEYAPERERER